MLASESSSDRFYAIWTLAWIGPPAKSATPKIIQALADKDDGVLRDLDEPGAEGAEAQTIAAVLEFAGINYI